MPSDTKLLNQPKNDLKIWIGLKNGTICKYRFNWSCEENNLEVKKNTQNCQKYLAYLN